MNVFRPLLLSTLLGACTWAQAAAVTPTVLAKLAFDETYMLSSAAQPSTAIELKFSYSLVPGGLTDLDTIIFGGRLFIPADAGQTFTLSVTDTVLDPGLSAFLARASNGFDDDLRDDAIGNNGGGIGSVAPESVRIDALVPVSGPDLQGHALSAVELFIAELFIDPSASGDLAHWEVRGELRFLGEPSVVPLPAAWLLFASATALGGLALRRPWPIEG